jgi:hypothetical protein
VTRTVAAVVATADRDGEATSRRRPFDRRLLADVAIGMSLVAILALPVLLSTRAFFGDWGNHLHLVDQQTRWLHDHLFPTYFLHSAESGAFSPQYMFYGGSLYAVTGWLGVLLGSSVYAFRLSFVMAFSACYFGTLWIARQLEVQSLRAHIPGVLAVSGAYFLSKAYYDGGWPEFVAVSMIPLVAAAGLSIVRSKRVPLPSATLLVVGVFFLTGAHNITIEYGALFLFAIVLPGVIVYRRMITRTTVRRFALVSALVALATALNAWFLVPLARYAHLTQIGRPDHGRRFYQFDGITRSLESWRNVFSPLRTYPALPVSNATPFYVQAPVYVLIWVTALGAFLLIRRHRSRNAAMYFSLTVVLGALLTLLLWQGLWDVLPDALKVIQFRYRLHSYINYTVVGLVIVGLLVVASSRRARTWIVALLLATAISLGLATWQAWSAPTYLKVGELVQTHDHLPPIAFTGCPVPCPSYNTDYRIPGDFTAPLEEHRVDIARARTGSADIRISGGRGPYSTNVAWSPVLELMGRARIIGATPEGLAVIAPTAPARGTASVVRARFRPKVTGPVVIGRVVSVTAGAMLLIWLLIALTCRAQEKRRQID